jgi:hypothetical protein
MSRVHTNTFDHPTKGDQPMKNRHPKTQDRCGRALGRHIVLALAGAAITLSGCSFGGGAPESYFNRISGKDSVESHLAGEALAQRKSSMRRIRRDLGSFQETLEQLQRHGKANGITRFERFAKPYVALRVDPLIDPTQSNWHPELRPFHAELLLSKAVLLHQMGEKRAVRNTIAQLETDFDSVHSMLVLYPTGEAVTLEQGIALLRSQTGES